MTYLKHIFISGPDHNKAFLAAKQIISPLCSQTSCKMIDVSRFVALNDELINSIGPATQIYLLFHGAPCQSRRADTDTHCLSVYYGEMPTYTLLNTLQLLAPDVPLNIHLFSCYASLAHKSIAKSLINDGSILTAYAPENHPALGDAFFTFWPTLFEMHHSSMFQAFMHNILPIAAMSGSLSVSAKHQAHIFQPKMDEVLAITRPHDGAIRLQNQFIDFYTDLSVEKNGMSLVSPTVTENDVLHYQGTFLSMAPAHGNMGLLNQFASSAPEQFKKAMTQEKIGMLSMTVAISMGGETVPLFLEHGAEPNSVRIYDGMTPLLMAVINEQFHSARHLLEHGADPNKSKDNTIMPHLSTTPLMAAVQNGHKEMVELLLEYDVDVNQVRKTDGRTPLFEAVLASSDTMVQILLNHDADVNLADFNGLTPLMAAATQFYNFSILKLLIYYGADPNAEESDGATPIFRALSQPDTNTLIIKALIEAGTNMSHKYCIQGNQEACCTANDLAHILKKDVDLIDMLEQAETQQQLLENLFPDVTASTEWVAKNYLAAHENAYSSFSCDDDEWAVYSYMDSYQEPMVICDTLVS